MPQPFTVILVDLDGTVMESASSITGSLATAMEELGHPVPPPARMVEFVGPPLLDGLRDIAGLPDDAARAVLERYRVHYRAVGAFEAEPYPGIREALEALRTTAPLAIATSKPESIATRILEHAGLAPLFTVIAGASDDESRSRKADVITRALELLADRGVDVTRPVMIGDRIHDVEGAAAHGIPTVVAGWGYGAPEETAGAIAIARSTADLPGIIAAGWPRAADRPPGG
ncbi:HAD hydrolase-like protein [Amnibacterium sp.]|uniref:HAD hydrolase-like protein n=1 Tax=Amnibacterium sp. TaxID=1872496 RepID=UPI003F7C836D